VASDETKNDLRQLRGLELGGVIVRTVQYNVFAAGDELRHPGATATEVVLIRAIGLDMEGRGANSLENGTKS